MIDTILLLGAAQGVFLAVVLFSQRSNSVANKLLSVGMLAFSIYILQSLYYVGRYYDAYPHFIGVSVPLVFVFGPILYLYARSVSAGGQSFRKVSLLHFAPFALTALYLLPFYLQNGDAKRAYLQTLIRDGPPADLATIERLYFPHGILYVVLTIAVLRRHRARVKATYSSVEHVNLSWLRNVTIAVGAVWALATLQHVLDSVGVELTPLPLPLTALALSLMIYALGYLGLRQPEIFHAAALHPSPEPLGRPELAAAVASEPAGTATLTAPTMDGPPPTRPLVEGENEGSREGGREGGSESTSYGKSGLTQAQAEAYAQRLLRLMDERRLYKTSQLTLQELADELSISPHNLSEVINTQLGKNFYDFVNGLRVEEVKRQLQDPRSAHLTVYAIALESGFNSKSTFNTFFKRQTGVTPSEYRRRDLVQR